MSNETIRLSRLEYENLGCEIWHLAPGVRTTARAVHAYQRRARRLAEASKRRWAAMHVHDFLRRARYLPKTRRAAWIKRHCAWFPEYAEALRRGDPEPTYEELNPNRDVQLNQPGVYVATRKDRELQIAVIGRRGALLAYTLTSAGDTVQAQAINLATRLAAGVS